MTDERTGRPQYGEYATPEEQRARIRQPDATWAIDEGYSPGSAPPPPAPEPTMDVVKAERGSQLNRVVTLALLLVGVFNVILGVVSYLDFPTSVARTWDVLGIPGEFTNLEAGRIWGIAAAGVLILGYVITVLFSIRLLRRGKTSWWIPLVGAVVTYVVVSLCLGAALIGDPAFVEYATTFSG